MGTIHFVGAEKGGVGKSLVAALQKIDGGSRSFWAAMNNAAGEGGLGLLEQQRLWVWIKCA